MPADAPPVAARRNHIPGGGSSAWPFGAVGSAMRRRSFPAPPTRRAAARRRPGPCGSSHVPAVGGGQLISGLQALGDQRCVLFGRRRVTEFHRGRDAWSAGTIPLQLCFRSATARISGWWNAYSGPRVDLTWSLTSAPTRSLRHGFECPAFRAGPVATGTDDRRISRCVWLPVRGGRSRGNGRLHSGGTLTSTTSDLRHIGPRLPCSTPRSRSPRTISSAKNGLPAARPTICASTGPTDESAPSSSVTNATVCESLSGARAMLCAPGHSAQRAPIFGPIGDQHQRASLGDHAEKIGQHRFADRIDPMCVLNDEIAGGLPRHARY